MSAVPFNLLTAVFGDDEMATIFSEQSTVDRWIQTEIALAWAQAEAGVISKDDAAAIEQAAKGPIDLAALRKDAATVGYPILGTVRWLSHRLPPGPDGRVHFGATTQDIMDTGLALQLRDALQRLDDLLLRVGDGLSALVQEYRGTVQAGRTHALHAVPTTFGAKLAVYLGEVTRHRQRIAEIGPRLTTVSLHGAAGTSAALGPKVGEVRRQMAERLGLFDVVVPWHVARDSVAEFGYLCSLVAATCARMAREVVDLSRTEIGEVAEQGGLLRGASSTMPQKANPITSEGIIGMSISAGALTGGLHRIQEAGHERSAGEWQVEWFVIPHLAWLSASCVLRAALLVEGLRVFPEQMRSNLEFDHGLIMAEAYMIRLAEAVGREVAHELVYAAVGEVRASGRSLRDVLSARVNGAAREAVEAVAGDPTSYLGEVQATCDAALAGWRASRHERRD